MLLENSFTIDAPIEQAWKALNTPETIAPCFPGATLTEYEGDTFSGTVKVKLGPISLTYKGKGVYTERDDAAHRVVIDASGRDSRGNGTADATVTGTLTADGPDKTAVTMVTDMKITGRPAQFGRGVIGDVADKIIQQFATCVASKLQTTEVPAAAAGTAGTGMEVAKAVRAAAKESAEGATQADAPAAAAESGPTTGTAPDAVGGPASTNGAGVGAPAGPARSSTPAAAATTPAPTPHAPLKSEIDAIDLLDTAGAPLLKRLALPVAGGVLLIGIVVFVVRWLRTR